METTENKESKIRFKWPRIIISWLFFALFLFMTLGSMTDGIKGIATTVILLLCTICIMPISAIQKPIRNILKAKTFPIKIASITVLFFIAIAISPASHSSASENAQIESEKVSEIETESEINTEKKTAVVETEVPESEVPDTEVADTEVAESTETSTEDAVNEPAESPEISISDIPEYSGSPYVVINDNIPYFSDSDKTRTDAFENYSALDSKGRCGVAYANICKELMPTEERGAIGSVKPTGWHTVKYDIVDGKYLYNRCHLIGYQLAAENANEKNLITGTRYLNVDGMLPFENMVADYVKESSNHVLYRVTPVFEGDNLLAAGVLMEAYSVEDQGSGVLFNVFCYNVQPGVTIDYASGDSELNNEPLANESSKKQSSVSSSSSSESTAKSEAVQEEQVTPAQEAAPEVASEPVQEPAPEPAPEAVTDSSAEAGRIVYIAPDSGTKYHYSSSCRGLSNANSIVEMTESEAQAQGYGLCGWED